ncbi:MAG TPA: glycosyltransferase [Xanthobacteraceae bacterium]
MLSVVITTLDSERPLVATLAALVPGAVEGLISEVLVADGGSRDDTTAVAEVAGCKVMVVTGTPGRRLGAAATAARTPWLLFLRPGTILDAGWISEARRFMEESAIDRRAAAFRRVAPRTALREALLMIADALVIRVRPEQGLLIAKKFYHELGGHFEAASDPETDLIRRIGRRRIMTLPSSARTAR